MAAKRRGLGRGLDALLGGDTSDETQETPSKPGAQSGAVNQLGIDQIQRGLPGLGNRLGRGHNTHLLAFRVDQTNRSDPDLFVYPEVTIARHAPHFLLWYGYTGVFGRH